MYSYEELLSPASLYSRVNRWPLAVNNRKTKIMKLMLFFLCFLFHQLLLVSKDNWIHLMKIKRRTVNPKSWLVNLSKKNRNKTNHEGNVHSSQGTTTWKRQKLVCCGSYSCIFVSWGLCSFISCRFKPQETIPRKTNGFQLPRVLMSKRKPLLSSARKRKEERQRALVSWHLQKKKKSCETTWRCRENPLLSTAIKRKG